MVTIVYRVLLIVTIALVTVTRPTRSKEVCQIFCDGEDSQRATLVRNATQEAFVSRILTLSISESLNMAFASLTNGQEGDEIWLDRSFDAGNTWEEDDGSMLGFTTVAPGNFQATTNMFNVDDSSLVSGMGAVRACIHIKDGLTACSEWARSEYMSGSPMEAAVTALMQFYKADGLWQTVGWWNAANCLTAMIDYLRLSKDTFYTPVIEDSYVKNLDGWWGNFTSDALDDVGWWALAWVDAYDLTGNKTYLDMAILDAEHIVAYRDDVCGDGIWWNIYRNYKNAITNELYIKIAAQLHNRLPGDTKYLREAVELWDWFMRSGMVNEQSLINDGLTDACTSNNDTTWTYNQGVILGAAVELAQATSDPQYITQAVRIADAVIASRLLSPAGILREPCEDWTQLCDGNQSSFKGIFLRNLAELNRVLPNKPYQTYLENQVRSNFQNNRNSMNQHGLHFAGPFDYPDANRQHSVVDAYVASLP
jgi:predicted alpha-1,6-mannanase (GH76 family)